MSNSIKFYLPENKLIVLDDFLRSIIKDYSQEIDSRILVVDNRYRVRTDSFEEFTGRTLKHTEIQKALQGTSNASVHNYEGIGHVMYVAVPITLNEEIKGVTLISSSLNTIYSKVEDIKSSLRLIGILTTFIIGIISYFVADFLSKPLEKFTQAIKEMAQGKLGKKVRITTNDEFKQLGSAFNIMSTKLDQVDKQRKDFVANVSHELRTPLSSIKLLSESLIHQNEDDISVYKDFLKNIDSEIDRLNNIIDDLLTLVDLDKAKLNLEYKTTYINYLLENIISNLMPLADKKDIDLKLIEKEKIQIKIDQNKIQQAIINIIHNAIKYTPEGGKVEVTLYTKNRYTIIKVKDNGIGIPKESLPNIFERFYRVDKARSRNTGGTGLGLSIAYQIVTLHQGAIEVESEVGKGSTFYIKIPNDIDLS
ncbi:sensor histidine kinase [Thermohalobacter berrensis]|uniref:sensor histidine kinase n=1 Tax=Thermohalobacter berrensis TaxID=99594 RepID=UPI001FA97450|nr:ATP-binding protein [Thermohalobacter berrensis]